MSEEEKIRTVFACATRYYADSVEWCPLEPFTNLFVCGTYQLSQNDAGPERLGGVDLYSHDGDSSVTVLLQSIDTDGVLDQKWCCFDVGGSPRLGTADARGVLRIYKLTNDGGTPKLTRTTEISASKDSSIGTSLDWSCNKFSDPNPVVAVSDTSGSVTLIKYHAEMEVLERMTLIAAHGFESWICAFDCWNPSVLFTGGDDCKLHMYDTKSGTVKPQRTISRDMGVTSMHFNIDQEHIFVSGGYDGIMCIWDARNLSRTVGDVNLGGGIWRLKWEPGVSNRILAACMYGGFRIVDCVDLKTPTSIVEYKNCGSLAYGADWCVSKAGDENPRRTIATCTFYDCQLNVAELNL